MGETLPTPETEDVGGFAYEAVYLMARHAARGKDPEEHFERVTQPRLERLEEALAPTDAARFALYDARRALEDLDRFGLPEAGGFNDQDASWLLLVRCALAARERAEAEREREEAPEPQDS